MGASAIRFLGLALCQGDRRVAAYAHAVVLKGAVKEQEHQSSGHAAIIANMLSAMSIRFVLASAIVWFVAERRRRAELFLPLLFSVTYVAVCLFQL